ncbi:hypothetical protein HK104_008343 [Borealophlyctis nickersoniae]|nr:hypothetical protein HK104_008343 [Borealophlyctis nickersoniae]
MTQLDGWMQYFAARYVQNYCDVRVTLSGSNVPGEGEVKIFGQLMSLAGFGDTEKDTFAVLGGDPDMAIQAVACRIPPTDIIINADTIFSPLALISALSPERDPDRQRIDFAFLLLMAGNDYLPPLKWTTLGTLRNAYEEFRKAASNTERYLVDPGSKSLDLKVFGDILSRTIAIGSDSAAMPFEQNYAQREFASDVRSYLEGLLWNLDMYTRGECSNYRFAYAYPASPSPRDILDFVKQSELSEVSLPQSNGAGQPLTPHLCAVAMLPKDDNLTKPLLPPQLERLMDSFANDASCHDNPNIVKALQNLETLADLKLLLNESAFDRPWRVRVCRMKMSEPPPVPPNNSFPSLSPNKYLGESISIEEERDYRLAGMEAIEKRFKSGQYSYSLPPTEDVNVSVDRNGLEMGSAWDIPENEPSSLTGEEDSFKGNENWKDGRGMSFMPSGGASSRSSDAFDRDDRYAAYHRGVMEEKWGEKGSPNAMEPIEMEGTRDFSKDGNCAYSTDVDVRNSNSYYRSSGLETHEEGFVAMQQQDTSLVIYANEKESTGSSNRVNNDDSAAAFCSGYYTSESPLVETADLKTSRGGPVVVGLNDAVPGEWGNGNEGVASEVSTGYNRSPGVVLVSETRKKIGDTHIGERGRMQHHVSDAKEEQAGLETFEWLSYIEDSGVDDIDGKSNETAAPSLLGHLMPRLWGGRVEEVLTFACSCEGCGKAYKRKQDLEGHLREKHGIESSSRKRLPCPHEECGRSFAAAASLRNHLVKSHQRAKLEELFPFAGSCEGCDEAYGRKRDLERHLREKHGIESSSRKRLPCPLEECGRSFAAASSLRNHLVKQHQGAKLEELFPFACFCGEDRRFLTEGGLYQHQRKVHTVYGGPLFQCLSEGCGKLFETKRGLKRHAEEYNHSGGTEMETDKEKETFVDHIVRRTRSALPTEFPKRLQEPVHEQYAERARMAVAGWSKPKQ